MSKLIKNKRAKMNNKFFRFDIIILSCVITFAACFILYMKNGDLQAFDESHHSSNESKPAMIVVDDNKSSFEDVQSEVSNPIESIIETPVVANPVSESEALGMEYFDNCIFVGDSLITGLSGYNIISPNCVVASMGLNLNRLETEIIKTPYGENTVIDTIKKANKENIYIMLGTNGIGWLQVDKMIENYSSYVDKLKNELPKSKIYILSIPPVTEKKENETESSINNSKIDEYNSKLLEMANKKGIYFVDINTALKNNQGKLDLDKATNDGYHFKRATYDIMTDYILKHVAK